MRREGSKLWLANRSWRVASAIRKRRLVEAAGVEPASESIPHGHLHVYPEL